MRGGEIVGIAGVAGNGQDELFAALSGERLSPSDGTVVIDGKAAGRLTITDRRRLGAAFVPEERLGHGAAPRMKLSENALLTGHAGERHGRTAASSTGRRRLRHVDRTTKSFDVRKAKRDPEAAAFPAAICRNSSSAARSCASPASWWSTSRPGASMPAPPPTIRQALIDLAGRGSAVLVISQDLDELFEIADRIAVMFHGDAVGAAARPREATREKLGLLMGGAEPGRTTRDERPACSWCLNASARALDAVRGRCRR